MVRSPSAPRSRRVSLFPAKTKSLSSYETRASAMAAFLDKHQTDVPVSRSTSQCSFEDSTRVRRERHPGATGLAHVHQKESASLYESTYQYEPLDTTRQQIRLLRLQTSATSYTPCCEISIFDMNALPTYIALSYAWDEDTRPKSMILLNEKQCSVGQTLCTFFRHFQNSFGNTDFPWLWIDQLCINQSEVREKNHQIPLMSLIYSRCSHVIAWLGTTFSGFETLLNDRYFTRLWIVQEILLAPEVRILCGDQWFLWSDLQDSMASDNAPSWSDIQPVALSLLLDHGQHQNGQTLCHYINYYSGQDCRDSRDKIYGLLGLLSERRRPTVDYALSVTRVYVSAVDAMHKEYWQQKNESGRLLDFYQACSELFTNMELSGKHPGGVPDYPSYLLKRLEENEENHLVVRRTKTRSAGRPQEYLALVAMKPSFPVCRDRRQSSHVRGDIPKHISKQPEQSDDDSAQSTLIVKAKQEQVSPVAFPKRILESSVSQRAVQQARMTQRSKSSGINFPESTLALYA